LWVGTLGSGLARLPAQGNHFERIAAFSPASSVHALLFDEQHGLWVGTASDLVLIDTADGHVLRQIPLPHVDDSPAQLRQMCLDGDGNLWIGTTLGVFRLSAGSGEPVRVAAAQISDARRMLVDHAGQLLVSTKEGLWRITADGAARRIWSSDAETPISAMAEDAQGRLWLAVPHRGIALFDPARDDTSWLTPRSEIDGSVPDAVITTLQLDRSGLLWLGTHERGLAKVDPSGTLFSYVTDVDPMHRPTSTNYIRSFYEDGDATLWVGTEGGLKRYYPAENRFESYADLDDGNPAAPALVVHAMAPAEAGRIWIGTNQGAGLFDPAQRTVAFLPVDPDAKLGLADIRVRALLRARDGSLWIGTTQGGLARHDPRDGSWVSYRHTASGGSIGGLSDDRVLALLEDRQGRIWSGNMTGLNLVDPAQRSVRVFRSGADAQSLSADLVRSIHESDDGQLWIGTQSGLNRLDALDDTHARFSHWLPRDGLPGGTVYAIESDTMGRLWVSTNRGITSFERSGNAFRSFSLADGLQGMEYNGGAATRLRNGQFAFGGINGFNLFQPQAMVGSRYAAPVVFTAVRVGRNETPVRTQGKAVEMALADRVVRFEFAALDFSAPERNRFAYRLDGFDDRWIDAGVRHDTTYTNLDAGKYVFQVRAANHDGYWGEQVASIGLRVTPPWWDSLAARSAYALLGGGLILLGWRAQRERRRDERDHHLDLQEREDRLRLALWGSGDDFWDWDVRRETLVVTRCSDLFKKAVRQPVARNHEWLREHIHPDDLPATQRRLEQHINRVTDTFESEHRLRNRRGEWVWSLARGKIVERDGDGQPQRMCGTARDVTLARAAEHDRRIAQEVIRSMGEAVAVTDTGLQFLSVNPAFARITGWRHEEIVGRSTALLNCSQHPPEHYQAIREELTRTGHWRGELWQRRKNGEEFLSWMQVSEVRDASGQRTHFVSVISDITDRKRTEQELRYLANYDALTGLPNRTLLTERIGHAIIRARRGTRKVAVLFLDLDRFKHVNDSMGHAVGDRMLKAAGSRLRQVVREGDSVARLGGDEFTVVLENIGSGAEAERVAEKIIAAFEQPLELDNGQEVVISPSIGISLHPDHGQVPSDLLKFADTAMYQAKEHGRKTWMVYTEAMDAAARLRATTVSALRKALERNELSLVYQPKLSLLDERITGVEALLRWRSAELGNVSPGVFIPIAEETGLIIEIGDWVVAQAVAQLAHWRDEGVCDITMSINVSVAQLLRGDLIRRLCDVLAEHDIAPNLLELELTESMVMANAEQSITTLRRLKAVGVTLAIDDFGTGYSSLSYLKRLPIDTLKIDKEFVGDITTDPDDEAITATVITMAHSLGLNVVAEGVERAEQVEYLREQDCDEVQGHWLAFPLPPDQCLAFLRERAQRRRVALGEG
jgi:diguanylate cyclase (GGDEF)-like protein/PAS domain S-box-containing protein